MSSDGAHRATGESASDLSSSAMSVPPNNNMANNLVVNVSIEASDEYQVQEITYDGQERYVQ